MRQLIVTGGAGFVGTNLIKRALEEGRKVYCLDVGDRFSRLSEAGIMGHPNFVFIPGDLAIAVPDAQLPDDATCIHLAALAHVDYSVHNPSQTFSNNIQSTVNVFESARRKGWRVLFCSSVETYGSEVTDIITEATPLTPLSPYGASKVACENVAESYRLSYGVLSSTVRLTNLYGPWQLPDRIIPRLITQSVMGLPGEVDEGRIRDYLFVGDVVEAILKLDSNEVWGDVFNISSGEGTSNYAIADRINLASPGRASIQQNYARGKDGRGVSLVSSSTKLQDKIQWKPCKSMDEGVSETFRWYSNNSKWLNQFYGIVSEPRTSTRFIADVAFPLRPPMGDMHP